ncbi:MAG: ABC transporter ATP-binding protein [Bacteroides sp.]
MAQLREKKATPKPPVLKRLAVYMERKKHLIPLAMFLSGMSAILQLIPFILIWRIVQILLTKGGIAQDTPIYSYAWWAVGCAAAGIAIYYLGLMLSHVAAFRLEVNIRRRTMQKLLTLPLGFFEQNESGRMRKIIDDNASETHTFVAHLLPDLTGSFISPIVIVALILLFNWQLGLACLIPIISGVAVLSFTGSKRQKDFQNRYLNAQERMASEAVEYVRGIPVVKVFQQSVFSFRRFYESITVYRDLVSKYTLGFQKPMAAYSALINGFAFFLVPVAILVIGRTGELVNVISDLFLYILITPLLGANAMKIMFMQQDLLRATQAIDRLENLTEGHSPLVTEKLATPEGNSICFENVTFAYPDSEKNAIEGISFTIPEGQTYALVGASGGGKTTIARLIPRFWDVKSGSVQIGGVDVRRISKDELMRRIAFVFQNTTLFKTTLRENLLYGNRTASEAQIELALEQSRSKEIIARLPMGLETKIGVEGTYLSGGEQQRIALARAFLKDAPIVVLDEATAFADPENEHLIQEALQELMRGKTSLMIAHRLTSIRDVDKILVIDNGRIIETGTHDELLTQGGTYKKMWDEYQKTITWTV